MASEQFWWSTPGMPELPEVEVTRRKLSPVLVGRTITSVETTRKSYFFITPPQQLKQRLLERRVQALDRVGKYLLARLDDESTLLLHLGMTGQLFAAGALSPRLLLAKGRRALTPEVARTFSPDAHTHLILGFREAGPLIYFRDVRKFGKVEWAAPGSEFTRVKKLGPDALAATGLQLFEAAQARSTPVKTLLLDQGVLAGVGNIYADEALFLAKVRVDRRANRVTRAECDAIMRAAQKVMRRSIVTGGSSISDYVQPDGTDGGYQNERRVYARTGEPCKTCRTPIERLVIAQRSSHFCPRCQK